LARTSLCAARSRSILIFNRFLNRIAIAAMSANRNFLLIIHRASLIAAGSALQS
jgi:hypothetical protein